MLFLSQDASLFALIGMDEAAYSTARPERTAGHIALTVGRYVLIWGGYHDGSVSQILM